MTLNINIKIDLSTTEDRALIARAVREWVIEVLEEPELKHPDRPHYVLGIIDDVEVRVGI